MIARASLIATLIATVLGRSLALAPPLDGTKPLPVPRFVSLKSDRINLRVGPGRNYPILWVLTRKDMPVEIVREFDDWRMIEDWQGTRGWVQERMVMGTRNVIVTGAVEPLYASPSRNAALVARAEPGVIARLLKCEAAWCRIEAGHIAGWAEKSEVWGVFPQEILQ
jgi:SH3-like domain-containing protein